MIVAGLEVNWVTSIEESGRFPDMVAQVVKTMAGDRSMVRNDCLSTHSL